MHISNTRWHYIAMNRLAMTWKSEESEGVFAFLSQEKVPAYPPLGSGLLRPELQGRGQFLRLQHRLHPQREPPTDLQLLNAAVWRLQEAYKKILPSGVTEEHEGLSSSRSGVAMCYKYSS